MAEPNVPTQGRLQTLLTLLENDPANLSLITEAAEVALAEHEPAVASDLMDRYARHAALPAKQVGVAGLAAMQLGRFDAAASLFEQAFRDHGADPSVRFNLAWSRAMLKQHDAALALLDEATMQALPQAAMLRVQLLHDQGEIEDAVALATRLLQQHPDHPGLLAATSTLAMDADDRDFARSCAERARDHPEAMVTLGALALADSRASEADALFARAIERNPNMPRAWVGHGLAALVGGAYDQAARDIEHGANLFNDHIGSWIAAGWAKLLAGDLPGGRAHFERALALDHNFAETHGSLAVIYVAEGKTQEARRAVQTALRLDPQSYAGALAHSLLLTDDGRSEAAARIVDRALHAPLDASGRTVAQAVAQFALSR